VAQVDVRPGGRLTLRALREAVLGRELDYTRGSIPASILLLAVPMILEMMMEAIFGIMDAYFVSRLGKEAQATIALTESVMTLLYAVGIGVSMATTAMVARRVGEGEFEDAREAAFQSLLLGVLIAVPIGLVGFVFAEDIFVLMGAEDAVIAVGTGNLRVMLAGNATLVLLFLGNAVFRGAGNPAMALYVLVAANGINIILDPCLIFGLGPFPELGVTGAAVATNIGRGIGVCLQLYLLFRTDHLIRLRRRHIRINIEVMRRILFLSMGGIIQFVIATTSWIFLVRYVAAFGSEAVAGYGIAIRIMIFMLLPAWGISNAAATLVGQNLGAGQVDRASRSVWMTGAYNMVFLLVVMIVFLTLGQSLIDIFTDDPAVLAEGALCLRVVSYGFVFYALGMVLTQSFNGSGDTWTPTGIKLVCYWMIQIPLVHHQAGVLGTVGIYGTIVGVETLQALILVVFFKMGRWQRQRV